MQTGHALRVFFNPIYLRQRLCANAFNPQVFAPAPAKLIDVLPNACALLGLLSAELKIAGCAPAKRVRNIAKNPPFGQRRHLHCKTHLLRLMPICVAPGKYGKSIYPFPVHTSFLSGKLFYANYYIERTISNIYCNKSCRLQVI